MSVVGALLLRGILAGILAGLLAVGFAEIFGEPQVGSAIAFEAAAEKAVGAMPEPELVSRAVQRSIGLLTAGLTFGAALGGLLALIFAGVYGRISRLAPRPLAALLAAGGFLAVTLVPQLKYPASPPAVGMADTIGLRTALYFEMIAISLAALTLALLLGRRVAARFGGWNAALLGAGLFILVVIGVQFALPEINEVPDAFPAVVLWRFRIAALGMQAVLWASLGLIYGILAERRLAQRTGRSAWPAVGRR
jgi:predicted cobalt transporter CbtA